MKFIPILFFLLVSSTCLHSSQVLSLNGQWQIEEGDPFRAPDSFGHTVPVPGLVKLASPAFPDVGSLQSKAYRQAFWYRTEFKIEGEVPPRAILKIGKAKYGTKVFLNGRLLGERLECFTPLFFDVADALKGNGTPNELLVCLGHWIDSIPPTHPAGFDREKLYYHPGIYDDVSLELSGTPHIETIQIVPQIETGAIRAVLKLKNDSERTGVFPVALDIFEKGGTQPVGATELKVRLTGGETQTVSTEISISGARLWSPEDPFLYELRVNTPADEQKEVFGLRSFRFDPETSLPLLNGKPYYLRGTNICIFRFFDDEASGDYSWDEAWVRKYMRSLKKMHWNSARFCIGFPPELWYRIADEEGLLVQDEFPLWTFRYARYGKPLRGDAGGEIYVDESKLPEFEKNLTDQARQWMEERWNHPCVVIWDMQNETVMTDVTGNAIQAVRGLDLSDRPWDNGESPMQRATDPLELHIYPFVFPNKWPRAGIPKFEWSHLPRYMDVPLAYFKPERVRGDYPPIIVNEYVALWVNRNGDSCTHSIPHFERILGKDNTAENRWRLSAESVAKMTELLRTHWRVAGVMQFCALGYSRPDAIFLEGATCDFMVDLEKIAFHPYYARVVADAFAPVGVMLDEWAAELPAGASHPFEIALVNDLHEAWSGSVSLRLEHDGRVLVEKQVEARIEALGSSRISIDLELPRKLGPVALFARLEGPHSTGTESIRRLELVAGPGL